jgi:enoyl-CoA hydratase/carnithine racemase
VICGHDRFFSAGADRAEIARLDPTAGYAFSKIGQEFRQTIDEFPAPVAAAISDYGGGFDLALARRFPIAHPTPSSAIERPLWDESQAGAVPSACPG